MRLNGTPKHTPELFLDRFEMEKQLPIPERVSRIIGRAGGLLGLVCFKSSRITRSQTSFGAGNTDVGVNLISRVPLSSESLYAPTACHPGVIENEKPGSACD